MFENINVSPNLNRLIQPLSVKLIEWLKENGNMLTEDDYSIIISASEIIAAIDTEKK